MVSADELRKKLEDETDAAKQTSQINEVVSQENVPSLVSAIPAGQFEANFSPQLFASLLEHSDPELKALASFVVNGSSRFKTLVLDCALKHLRACYKLGQFERGAKALGVVIKYLASGKQVESGLCERILSIVALYTSNQLNTSTTSQVVVITAKCIELNYAASESTLQSVVEDLVLQDTRDSLVIAFSALATLFHVNISIAQQIFVLPQVQQQQFTRAHFVSEAVVVAALEALSAACVSKECRALVAVNFKDVVEQALSSTKQSVGLLAASIWVKTKATSETDNANRQKAVDEIIRLSEKFEDAIGATDADQKYLSVALEGLAYTSLITKVKKRVVTKPNLVKRLVSILERDLTQTPWVYCSLCILANVTEYTSQVSTEEQKMKDLKNYAGKASVESEKEENSVVTARCKLILDTGICGIISTNCPRFTIASKSSAAVVLRNLVTERTHRTVVTKQGGLAVIIYLLIPAENTQPIDNASRIIAASALAKTLISVDPALALSNKVSPLVMVKPLCEQLAGGESESTGSLLDTFEALLALTNLASGPNDDDDAIRRAIIRESFAKVEVLMASSNELVQRASVELICNLSQSPHCAEKFLDQSGPANSRLDIVAVLTDTDDRAACLAAAGALATLAGWGKLAGDAFVKRDKVMEKLVLGATSGDTDLMLRVVVALESIAETDGFKPAMVKQNAFAKLSTALQSCSNAEVREGLQSVVSILKV